MMNHSKPRSAKSAKKILNHHLFLYNQYIEMPAEAEEVCAVVDEIMQDYDSTSVLVVNEKFYLGDSNIKQYYSGCLGRKRLGLRKKIRVDSMTVEGDLIHLKWDAAPHFEEADATIYVHDNKIKYQKISFR